MPATQDAGQAPGTAAAEGTVKATASGQNPPGAKKKTVTEQEWCRMVEEACRVAGISKAEAGYVHANTWGIRNLTELNHALQTAYPRDQKIKKIPKLYKAIKKLAEANKMLGA